MPSRAVSTTSAGSKKMSSSAASFRPEPDLKIILWTRNNLPMNSPVQKIKERLGIEEIVSSYIKLDRAGATLKARCPFHNEKTPSFFVSPDRGSYYCFGCGASGDIFT